MSSCNVYRFDIINAEDKDLFCIDKTVLVMAYNEDEAKGHVNLPEKYEVQLIEGPCVLCSIE